MSATRQMALNRITMASGRAMVPIAAPPHRAGRQSVTFQVLLLLLPFTWASLFLLTRPLGSIGLAAALGPLVFVAIQGGRRYIAQPLVFFAAITAIYALLSYFGFLDQQLTLLFSSDVVFQQAAYGLFLVFAVASFAFYHEGIANGNPIFLRVEEAVFFLAVIARLYILYIGSGSSGDRDVDENITGLSQFVNSEAFLAFIFVRRFLNSPNSSRPISIFITLCLVATAGSAQSRIALLPLLALVIFPSLRKAIAIWFVVLLVGIILVAWPFADQIWHVDPNTGIRLFFWHDAVHRFLESHGVGVGFGTETIRPLYSLTDRDVSLETIDDPGFILIASHNAMIDAIYRMGVLGFGILMYFVVKVIAGVLRSSSLSVFDCWIICMTATVLLVNVGLVSFNFFFGSAFLLGWLMYRATRSRVPATY
jgi:hypothetical protein